MELLKNKKFWILFGTVLALSLLSVSAVFAGNLDGVHDPTAFEKSVNDGSDNAAGLLRKIVGVITAVLLIWAGFLYATGSGDAQKLEQSKTRVKGAIIGLLIVIFADKIVGAVYGLFGGSPTTKFMLSMFSNLP